MIEAVNYVPEHQAKITPRDCHINEVGVRRLLPAGPRHTFLIEGKPVAIFGGTFIHPGFFQAWAYFSDDITKYPIEFTRKTKRMVDIYIKRYTLNRFEINVRADFPAGLAFARALGFTCEGLLHQYGVDGADHFMFARCKWQP